VGFLGLQGRTVLVTGVANRKSVAWHVHQGLVEAGARPLHVVRDEATRQATAKLLGGFPVYTCDVERQEEIDGLAAALAGAGVELDGLVHSIAFANYSGGVRPFHETERADFLQALDVSCFSLVALSRALGGRLAAGASVVTISISHTHLAAESYGYMAPIKAALDSAVVFLAKSFAGHAGGAGVRFNAVKAGPLKTSSSAGIPGYLDNYLYAEQATLRHAGLRTEEVAATALFLLSPRSSGINAQGLVVDAGMGVNFFDREIVRRVSATPPPGESGA
jgi:enoyl-[acyl-carrier protein] reductase I